MTRRDRLVIAKKWIPNYSGKSIVKGYAKWFGVDLICTIKELRMIGVIVNESYEKQVLSSMAKKRSVQQKKEETVNPMNIDKQWNKSDEYFDFIAGFTSGGTPFGIKNELNDNYINSEKTLD